MSAKQKILKVLRDAGPDLTIEEAIYKLEVLRKVEIGMAQLDRGEGIEHEELFRELLSDGEENQDRLVSGRKTRSSANQGLRGKPKRKPRGGD